MELTKEQIEQMPASRELDALIAEYVLKEVIKHNWPCGVNYDSGMVDASSTNPTEFPTLYGELHPVIMDCHPDLEEAYAVPMPFYSTHIADAWMVLMEMKDRRPNYSRNGFALTEALIEEPQHEWKTVFKCQIGGHRNRGYADTAPLAICRAALLATLHAE